MPIHCVWPAGWACRQSWCCTLVLGINGLLSVVLCQQVSTGGDVGLICLLLKIAGFSMRKGIFTPTALLQMGVFVKIDPYLSCRAPGLLLQGSVLWMGPYVELPSPGCFFQSSHGMCWSGYRCHAVPAGCGRAAVLLLGEPSRVKYIFIFF